eukprot:1136212-Pelagomonas_calceolata.AAC.2
MLGMCVHCNRLTRACTQNLGVVMRMAKFTGIRATSTASDTGNPKARRPRITEQVRCAADQIGCHLDVQCCRDVLLCQDERGELPGMESAFH